METKAKTPGMKVIIVGVVGRRSFLRRAAATFGRERGNHHGRARRQNPPQRAPPDRLTTMAFPPHDAAGFTKTTK
jgi:hypothetical protein